MTDFRHRSYQKELLDREDIPFADIKRNMQELDMVNTWLGGHSITIAGIRQLLDRKPVEQKELTICEIGCGGGDNLRAIHRWCKRRKIPVRLTGIDINPHCIEFARSRFSEDIYDFITSDYRLVSFAHPPDIIFSSLFCHHFEDSTLTDMLRWMQTHSRRGFFINDLHRHPVAYYAIQWLTRLFSGSYLVKNDAPLSVLRGFHKIEWQALCNTAGILTFSIKWKWAFRWLIVVNKSD